MIDIHAHVLPGVDDGAQDEQMSQDMFARAADAGIRAIVCTPHVYRPEQQKVNRRAFPQTQQTAHQHKLRLFMGAEFNYRALRKLETEDLADFCIASTPCILLELSNTSLFPGWEVKISELCECGYMPIIAHPERYEYIQKDMEIARELCDLGCELQVDAGGLMAGLFGAERRTARAMLSEGMVSYIASDAHRPQDYTVFAKAYKTFRHEWPSQNRLDGYLRALRRSRRRSVSESHTSD